MNDGLFLLLGIISSLLPNLVLAWIYKALTDGNWKSFCIAFAALIGIRLFFWVVDTTFRIVTWKLYRKRFVVQKILDDFRRFNFPMRQDPKEDWLMYLQRIQETESLPFTARRAAALMEGQMDLHDKAGVVVGMQSEGAMEAALEAWTRVR